MKSRIISDADDITRMRIMNASTNILLRKNDDPITIQALAHKLNLETAFIQKYFATPDDIIIEIIERLLQDIELILKAFVRSELEPLVVERHIKLNSECIMFDNADTARKLGCRILDHWMAILDHLIIRNDALMLLNSESIGSGKRHGSIRRLHRLFIPGPHNPVFAKGMLQNWTMPETCCFGWLNSNVFPILNYALLYDELIGCFSLKDDPMRKTVIDQIKETNQKHFDGRKYSF